MVTVGYGHGVIIVDKWNRFYLGKGSFPLMCAWHNLCKKNTYSSVNFVHTWLSIANEVCTINLKCKRSLNECHRSHQFCFNVWTSFNEALTFKHGRGYSAIFATVLPVLYSLLVHEDSEQSIVWPTGLYGILCCRDLASALPHIQASHSFEFLNLAKKTYICHVDNEGVSVTGIFIGTFLVDPSHAICPMHSSFVAVHKDYVTAHHDLVTLITKRWKGEEADLGLERPAASITA